MFGIESGDRVWGIVIDTLDAKRHLSGVRTYRPRTPRAIVVRSHGCGNATRHLSGAKKKATKIQVPTIVAVRDGLYYCKTCRSQPTLWPDICREKYHTMINFKNNSI